MVESRSVKTIILASGQGLTTLVGLISAMVLVRLFSKADYATYRQALLAYTFASPFAILGLDRALYYFLPIEKNRPRGVLIENLILLATGGILLTLFLALGGNELLARRFNNPELRTSLLIFAPYPLLMLPAASLGACLLAQNRAAQVAVYNVVSRLIILVAVLLPCLLLPVPNAAMAGTVAGAFVTTLAALTLMFRACPAGSARPTWTGIRKQVLFSVPLGLATLAGILNQYLDQVLVSALCEPEVFAVYVNGAMEIPLIGIVTGSVTSVLIVEYARLYAQGEVGEIVALIHRAMIKCALILIPAMAFLLCVAPELMRVLYGPAYEASADVFRVYLLLLPIRTLTFGAILMATGNSHYVLIQAILGLASSVCLGLCGIWLWGPIGAAVGSITATYLVSLPYLMFALRSVLNAGPSRLFPWRGLWKVVLASAVPALAVAGILSPHGIPDIVRLALAAAAYLVLLIPAMVALRLVTWVGIRDMARQVVRLH